MRVKDIIDKCVALLDVKSDKDDLLSCFNIIENELALDYFPLYAKHQCDANTVYYDDLEYEPVRIVSCNCEFKIYPTHIESKDTITDITYTHAPYKKGLYDECSYGDGLFNCLVYGTISEYLLTNRFYEEAILWNMKYKKEIDELFGDKV